METKTTFQDDLFQIFQIFWKSGYAYRHSNDKDNEVFYAKVLEDLLILPKDEFVNKYRFK